MIISIDTSALAKRYFQEPGSEELEKLFSESVTRVYVSTLVFTEFSAAVGRKMKDRELDKKPAAIAMSEFEKDWYGLFMKIPVTETLAESASTLALKQGLKGADAVHLSTAMITESDLFVVSDKQLTQTASRLKIRTYDPTSGKFTSE